MLETALSIGYISFFFWIIGKSSFFQTNEVSKKSFKWLFLLKLAAGFALFLVYTRFYPDRKYADIFRYYDDSGIIFKSAFSKPFDFFRMLTGYHQNDKDLMVYYNAMHNWFNSEMVFNDARTMIRLNVLFRFFSVGTYYPHGIFFCFMAFTGLTGLFKVAAKEIKERNILLLLAIFCMPSVLFWTSGVIKESFLVFAIGLMIYFVNSIVEKQGNNIKNIIGAAVSMFCLLNIKSYVFFALLPGLVAYFWVKKYSNKAFWKFSFVHLLYLITLYNLSTSFTHHPVPQLLADKQQEFNNLAQKEQAKSLIHLPEIKPELASVLHNAPNAFIVTLLRPHLLEAHNSMMLLSAIENLLIFLLILINLLLLLKRKINNLSITPIILLSIFFVIITFCLIGLVTPVLGAVVRYKVAALPFLMLLLFYQERWKKPLKLFTPNK